MNAQTELHAPALSPPGLRASAHLSLVETRAVMPTGEELGKLVQAIAERGDRAAFAALFRHFAPRVKTYAARLGLGAAEAEEVAQDTMLAVWRKAALFDPARAGASTWIFTIARNLLIDIKRREKRAAAVDQDDPAFAPEPAPSPEGIALAGDGERLVRLALEKLPPDQRTVIRMSYFSDKPQSEIAAALGIPLGTVKSRMRLATERLRALLDELK